ncbi:GNAT family N-acetyltransferase [Fontibacillus sp. BL9]|uniref:GNAT family N-acetyltransferase n=1 Tax=Fontibacillus sp. BL9 TaxID=3389971 RepID=UPI00397B1CCF
MDQLRLVKPQIEFKAAYLDFYQEWKQSGEDMVPWVIGKDPGDFQDMLDFLSNNEKGIGIPEGWVPDSTFWLVNDLSRVLGAVNIRHRLSDFLLHAGGHIGYGIRPSERNKGYASVLLKLALLEAKQLGISDTLVVCDADNIGSEKTIIANGGKPDSVYIEENGNVIKRYWIRNN